MTVPVQGVITILTDAGFRGRLLTKEPLSRHTSLKVGGPADLMAFPEDSDDLRLLVSTLDTNGVPRFVIGGGYNLLARDEGFRGCIVSLARFTGIEALGDGGVRAEAGVSNQKLVARLKELRLSGLEFIAAIPGTVGGALRMNAGAHGSAVMAVTRSVTLLRRGAFVTVPRSELTYGYRFLSLEQGDILTAAEFGLVTASREEIADRIRKYREYRAEHQKIDEPNAGSFFKNPPEESAWKLIDGAGMRGFQVGGARVSERHANYLVNVGNATASDFLELSTMIKMKVHERYGILLEEEVMIIPPGPGDQGG